VLVVLATMTGKPDKRDEIVAALTKAAVASRGDAGCLSYAFHRDLEDSDRYVAVERWADQGSLDAHFGTPHLGELFAVAGDLLAGPATIDTYVTDGTTG
jgi:quinol monooxygenase YgiN